ncbi:uncharacterized protein [Primulina eburnea]|uniref:uncharacterized protein n=1 Tax=Primulina eburnea TaxID=1245227 RepID=UPI003C6C7BBA
MFKQKMNSNGGQNSTVIENDAIQSNSNAVTPNETRGVANKPPLDISGQHNKVANLRLHALFDLVRRWGPDIRFQTHDSGWIIFTFPTTELRDCILNEGSYLVFGFHLFLKEMPRCFRFREEDMNSIPAWVQIHGLPPDCWNFNILSKLASRVGKPIHMDMLTHDRKRFEFARVLIEVETTKQKTTDIVVKLPIGDVVVKFIYEQDIKYCGLCKKTGHATADCCNANKVEQNIEIEVELVQVDNGKRIIDIAETTAVGTSAAAECEEEGFHTVTNKKKNKKKKSGKNVEVIQQGENKEMTVFFQDLNDNSSCETELVNLGDNNKDIRYFGTAQKGGYPDTATSCQ